MAAEDTEEPADARNSQPVEQTSASRLASLLRGIHAVRGVAISYAAIAAFVLYFALWVGSSEFYGSLGASPDDVGFGYPGTVVPIMLALIFALLITEAAGILFFLLIVADIVLTIRLFRRLPAGRLPIVLGGILFFTIFEGALRISDPSLPRLVYALAVMFPAPASYGLVAWIGSVISDDPGASADQVWSTMKRQGRWLLGIGAVATVLIAVIVTVAIIDVVPPAYVAVVRRGYPLDVWGSGSPWRASPAAVRWLDQGAKSPVDEQCVMYLGEANGYVLLYDVKAQHTVRVPSSRLCSGDDSEPARLLSLMTMDSFQVPDS